MLDEHEAAIEAVGKHLKFIKSRVSDVLPWLNDKTSKLRFEIARVRRSRSTKKITSSKFERLTERLRALNREFSRESGTAKREFLGSTSKVESVQQFWTKWKRTKFNYNDHIPIFDGNLSKSHSENIGILVDQFVRPAERRYQPKKFKPNAPAPQTDEQELWKIIMNTNNRKAPGPDQMANRLIKLIFKNDPDYLVKLYNCILRTSELPERWKVGRMIYFTKPNRRLKRVTDLRPITLINNLLKDGEALFAKVIETELAQAGLLRAQSVRLSKRSIDRAGDSESGERNQDG